MPPDAANRAADTSEVPVHEPNVTFDRLCADIAALTDIGKVRATNEDAFVVCRMGRYLERLASNLSVAQFPSRTEFTGHVLIVADGVGGHVGGEVASRTALLAAMRHILAAPQWPMSFDDPRTHEAEVAEVRAQATRYLATAHDELKRLASSDPDLADMGTTLTAAYVVDAHLFVVHVGDSKAYLVRKGHMRKITHDHTVAQEYADTGLIAQEDVANHRLQHVLTRAVGGPDEHLEGDIHYLGIASGDRLLLCSDGLTDRLDEREIGALLAAHDSSAAACRALVDRALDLGGRDNVTVIVAGFTEA